MARGKRRSRAKTKALWPTPGEMALLLALATIPALFNIQSGASFEPDKAGLMLALALVALIDGLKHGKRDLAALWAGDTIIAGLLGGLLLWGVVITAMALDPITSLWGAYERGGGLWGWMAALVFLFTAWRMARQGKALWLIDAALLGAVASVIYGYLQRLGLDPVQGAGISFPLGQRAASTLGNPLYLGDYLVLILALILARRMVWPPAHAGARRVLEGMLLLSLGLLILTGSRSAFLGLAVGSAVLILCQWLCQKSPGKLPGWVWGLAAGGVVLAGALFIWLMWPRLQHGGTWQQRLLIWQGVVEMVRARPRVWALGLGFDNLPLALAPYLPPSLAHFEPDLMFRVPDRAHTLPLDLVVTGGMVWVLGWMGLVGVALARLGRSRHPLAPYGIAAIIGRAALLGFSFSTHAPDLIFMTLLGISLAGWDSEQRPRAAGVMPWPPRMRLGYAAWGVFGFSLSAAAAWGWLWWMLTGVGLILLMYALTSPQPLPSRVPWDALLLFLLPPIYLLNRISGWPAQSAWAGLLLWLWALAWLPFAKPALAPRPRSLAPILGGGLVALLALGLLQLPRWGDIAYKQTWFIQDPTSQATALENALRLAPYDHVMLAGVAWIQAQRLNAEKAWEDSDRVGKIAGWYQQAIQAQPLAVEPITAYARWLASFPQPPAQTLDVLAQALTLSPHDLTLLNRRALVRAKAGDFEEAVADLQWQLTLDPLYAPTYLTLAQVYTWMGDEDAAQTIRALGRSRIPWWDQLPPVSIP